MNEMAQAFNAAPNSSFWENLTEAIADKVTTRVLEAMSTVKPRYYSRKEVAEMLHISLPTLARLMSDEILVGKKIGSRILYDAETIDKAVAENQKFRYRKK